MALLSDQAREEVWAQWMNDNDEPCTFTKDDLRAAVDAFDVYINSTASNANQALPEPFKSEASVSQKALLDIGIVNKRYREEA